MEAKMKKYIASGILSQEDVDKIVEIFLHSVKTGNMTIKEMEMIGLREGWFIRNPEYKESENKNEHVR